MTGYTFDAADVEWAPHRTFANVFARLLVGGQTNPALSLHLVRLEPGAEITPHTHDEAETFYLLSGRGVLVMGDEEIELGPGCGGLAPPGVVHGMRNPGPQPTVVLAIFTPPKG